MRRLGRWGRWVCAYANAALAFALLCAALSLIVCVIAALTGAYQLASGALYAALPLGVPPFCVLLARHINPEGNNK